MNRDKLHSEQLFKQNVQKKPLKSVPMAFDVLCLDYIKWALKAHQR